MRRDSVLMVKSSRASERLVVLFDYVSRIPTTFHRGYTVSPTSQKNFTAKTVAKKTATTANTEKGRRTRPKDSQDTES